MRTAEESTDPAAGALCLERCKILINLIYFSLLNSFPPTVFFQAAKGLCKDGEEQPL